MRPVRLKRREGGMVLVMLILVLVILLAIAAFALDLGRLYVLRAEMQNAADAAALAAAAELDAQDGAMERAEKAAIGMLEHNSHFARVKSLLGSDVTLDVEFFCAIGTSSEELIEELDEICPGPPDSEDPNKIHVASSADNSQAHYVRVTLNPTEGNNSEHYGIDLYFFPVLGLYYSEDEANPITTIESSASALAGRHFYMCKIPPVMLCDPFEESGGMRNTVNPGQQILLKAQGGNTWAPGNFGFLNLGGAGAGDIAEGLANELDKGCEDPEVTTATGGMTNKTAAAVNTRFDIYDGPPPFKEDSSPWLLYPPAPNVMDYPRDSDVSESNRIGNGDWDVEDYLTTHHSSETWPTNWSGMGRAEVYQWEIDNGYIPAGAVPDSDHVTAETIARRRIWHVAVLSCDALGVNGTDTVPIIEPDGFVKLFVTEHVEPPPNTDMYVEFMGWAVESDQDYHVVVQLYE